MLFIPDRVDHGYGKLSWHPKDEDVASCCGGIPTTQSKIERHLKTVEHFRTWCMEHSDQVRERFPEATDLTVDEILSG
jgi:hypothetical protein